MPADVWFHDRNRIGPVGAEGIAEALKESPVLRELHLSGNDLGDMGVAALVRGAVTGGSLKGTQREGGKDSYARHAGEGGVPLVPWV